MSTKRSEKAFVSKCAAIVCGLALAAFAVSSWSQTTTSQPPPPPMGGGGNMGGPMGGGGKMDGGRGMGGGDMARFVGFEGDMGDKLVTGAPYSADVTTEFTQTLSDGTVIDRKTTGSFARDGQGRTRRERTMPAFGPFAASGTPPTFITISDPVAHKHYMLNPKDKTAREMGAGPRMGGYGGGHDGGHGGGHDGGRGGEGNRGGFAGRGKDAHGGGHEGMRGGDEGVTVSLGTKTVQGVTVEGTRTTHTIAAGVMGNQQPIVSTFERWYSPDLLTVVMTVRSDPFMGKTTYMLTNLKRGEPDASLFQVPSDYKMITGGMHGGPGGPGGRSGMQRMHRGPGPGGNNNPNSGGGSNSNQGAPPPAAPGMPSGQGQDN